MLQSIGDGLIVSDQEGKVLIVNEAAEGLLSISAKELIGKNIIDALPLVDKKGQLVPAVDTPQVQALVRYNKISSDKYLYRRKDTTTFPIFLTVTPISLKQPLHRHDSNLP